MNRSVIAPRIALVVVNPQVLRQGCAPNYSFDGAGGTIGSRGADWILGDNRDRVHPVHCQIVLDEGAFCIVDRSGHTRINGSDTALGRHVSARLAEGDTLHIGPYRVSVHLHDQQHALPDPARHLIQYDVGELLNLQDERLDLFDHLSTDAAPAPAPTTEKNLLEAWLDGAEAHSGELDPLLALDADRAIEQTRQYSLIDDIHHGMTPAGTQPDLAATRFEAIAGRPDARADDVARLRPMGDQVPISDSAPEALLDLLQLPAPESPREAFGTRPLLVAPPTHTRLHDTALSHAIARGLDAALQSVASRPDLEMRFWEAFNQAYDQAQRTQRMEAQ
ncbi:FHA domain-containing protein [Phytopseudomonas dryadis]|uniref:FHA domain-containing protein n=1 Tax=Phytopseudomonas dryadis TaxID=2487520 RepID=A0A4Q9QV13_9GAMM|nr:FHA domain-containing protein [Pseudomonas dryadis]TBU84476.1 hypothetical protein DNK44_25060 [Pseudomonas dryadis]